MPYKAFVHYCYDCGHLTRSGNIELSEGCERCLSENTEIIDEEDYEDED